MPFPTPNLDDRQFQDIVDQAKSLIPQYCPEWTSHNVSDPGVTLIELFAWMTDMLLYRVNQVPDKVYIQLLELIGMRLEPPRAAHAPVTFYLSAAQPNDVTIPEGTEVATVQTETSPAILFTTEGDLTIRPPLLTGALSRSTHPGTQARWVQHDLRQLQIPGQQIPMFLQQPTPGDAFLLALEGDHSHHVLALSLDCELAGGAGVDPNNPPIEWQVWQGGVIRWAPCVLEYDGTGGFNRSGEIILHTPIMAKGEFGGMEGYWLRCHLTEAQAGPGGYQVSPDLEQVRIEARGGTASARHAVTVRDELLGSSDGTPGQTFHLVHTPILARDPGRDFLIVQPPGGDCEHWVEVADLADSGPESPHYTLDNLDGTLTLGPALLQPDGDVYRFGVIPPKGSTLRFGRYQHGGGVAGNIPRRALAVLKSSIPYVASVTNREAATGGREAQQLDDAMMRAPQALRTRTRAVTADDYEYLASQVPGVARSHCLAPGGQPGGPGDPAPGYISVAVLPQVDAAHGQVPSEQMTLSAELRGAVLEVLNARRLLGTALEVRQPHYVRVSVRATLSLAEGSSTSLSAEIKGRAESELYRYLNPYLGGPKGTGWPFGRTLSPSEIYGLLQRLSSVESVEDMQISVDQSGKTTGFQPAPGRLAVPPYGLICSGQHEVSVQ
jgi:predicted phage baseplate assembly protein